MDDFNLIQLPVPKELNYAVDMHLAALRRDGTKCTKAELIINQMRIGLIKESAKLINEGRTKL